MLIVIKVEHTEYHPLEELASLIKQALDQVYPLSEVEVEDNVLREGQHYLFSYHTLVFTAQVGFELAFSHLCSVEVRVFLFLADLLKQVLNISIVTIDHDLFLR